MEFDLISENEAKAKVRLTGYNYVGYFDVIIKKVRMSRGLLIKFL